jgi:membrane dipeptidase
MLWCPDGFDHPQTVYDLTDALLRRGYSDANVEAVLGGKFRRLLASTSAQPNSQQDKKS